MTAATPEPVEVPDGSAVILRAGCDGGVLILALAPKAGRERAIEVADNLHTASGLKVILVADAVAVKAWHPHDVPAELRAAMAEARGLRELVAEICDTLASQKYPAARLAPWRQRAGIGAGK